MAWQRGKESSHYVAFFFFLIEYLETFQASTLFSYSQIPG